MSVTCHGSSEFPMRSSFSSDYHCTIEKPIISSRVITLSFRVVGNMSLGKLLEPGPDNLFLGTEHGYAAIPNAATTYSAKSDTLISGTMTFELPEDAPPEATIRFQYHPNYSYAMFKLSDIIAPVCEDTTASATSHADLCVQVVASETKKSDGLQQPCVRESCVTPSHIL